MSGLKSRRKGYRFECKVRELLREKGHICIRQGKSAFPDLIALKEGKTIFVECKYNKYLSKEEKEEFMKFINQGFDCYVAYNQDRKVEFLKFEGQKTGEKIEKKFTPFLEMSSDSSVCPKDG